MEKLASCLCVLLVFGQPMNDVMGQSGSDSLECLLAGAACITPLSGQSNTVTSLAELQKTCSLFQTASTCLDGESTCPTQINQYKTSVAQAIEICDATFKGFCMESAPCYPDISHAINNFHSNCRNLTNMITCQKGVHKVCNLKHSMVTYENVYKGTNGMCNDIDKYPTTTRSCPAHASCLKSSQELTPVAGLFVQPAINDTKTVVSIMKQFCDVVFVCQLFQAAARCSVSSASACQYSSEFVGDMTTRQENLKTECKSVAGSDHHTSYLGQIVLAVLSGQMMVAVY